MLWAEKLNSIYYKRRGNRNWLPPAIPDEVTDEASRQRIWQQLIYQRERCGPARKSVDHDPARAEHISPILEKCGVVANMFDHGAGQDEVSRAIATRKSVRRSIGKRSCALADGCGAVPPRKGPTQ